MRKHLRQNIFFFSLIVCPIFTNAQYFGGISNGFSSISNLNLNLNLVDSLYNGGQGNGFFAILNPALNLNLIDSLYNGGIGNGYFVNNNNLNLTLVDSLYNGGIGKGDINIVLKNIRLSPCTDQNLVWNGNSNVIWGNASNWDCGTIPTSNSIVSIPSSMTRYPIILSNITIKQLWLYPSASLLITPIGELVVENP